MLTKEYGIQISDSCGKMKREIWREVFRPLLNIEAFLQKKLMAFSHELFLRKVSSQMFDRAQYTPLICMQCSQ